jgi:hypothetical protein
MSGPESRKGVIIVAGALFLKRRKEKEKGGERALKRDGTRGSDSEYPYSR